MPQTHEEYYSSEANYGKYQYTSLKEIIDQMMGHTTDPDHYLVNTRKSQMVMVAKDLIRELNREVKKTILAIEITVSPELYIALPQDYIGWVRVSVVTPDFRLRSLKENTNIQTALGYLQDNNYDILFDNNGEILLADSSNHFNKPFKKYSFCDPSEYGLFGDFVIDERRGVIGFSQELEDKEIVLEYISDGLQMQNLKEEEITVHKDLLDVLKSGIYYGCIKGRRHVPRTEKNSANAEYKSKLHKAKLNRLNLNISELNPGSQYYPNFSFRRS